MVLGTLTRLLLHCDDDRQPPLAVVNRVDSPQPSLCLPIPAMTTTQLDHRMEEAHSLFGGLEP